MDDSHASTRTPYLSYLFLGCLTVWLFGFSHLPAHFSNDRWYATGTILLAIYLGFWAEWTVHGILPAMVVALLFLWSAMPGESYNTSPDVIFYLSMVMKLSAVGLLLIIWSQFDRLMERPFYLALVCISVWILCGMLWVFASEVQRGGQMATMVFMTIVGMLAVRFAAPMRKNRPECKPWTRPMITAMLVLALAPLGGFGLANLWIRVHLDTIVYGGNWLDDSRCLRTHFSTFGESIWWSLIPPSLVMSCLLGLGFWRTLGRGHRQWKQMRMPTAWLISLWVLISLSGGFPVTCNEERIVHLSLLGILLLVFLVSDLLLLFYEQLALPVPPTGPSDVPHVPHP